MHRHLTAGALALALALAPTDARAQVRDTLAAAVTARDSALHDAARRALAVYNAPATLRVNGSLTVDSTRIVSGDVAVFGGTLVVAGHVTGRVAAINGSVELRPGARVDGEIIIVGGRLTGREGATVGGPVTQQRESVLVREQGASLVLEDDEPLIDRWWERWRTRRERSVATIRLSSGGTYNRVEGLPVHFGPVIRQRRAWGSATVEALGIYRSARDFRWDADNIGHDLRADVAYGQGRGVGVGARLYDVVTPVEDWHLDDTENGLASFVLHRDFRDHFGRHGRSGYVRAYAGEEMEVRLSLADQRWVDREVRDPWTLFRDDGNWRANPRLDEGRFHLANLTVRLDTRNSAAQPGAGWYLLADLERGSGDVTRLGPSSDVRRATTTGDVAWTRGFVDVRKYSRLAPTTQINVRAVLGGWLGGDELPLNRRLSLGGPGTLPGYDFRGDMLPSLTCAAATQPPLPPGGSYAALPPGAPAQCERVALAQVEYRSDLGFDVHLLRIPGSRLRVQRGGQWVLFVNSGRGWLVGPRAGEERYRAGQFPTLSTFRSDVGAGVDLGVLGVYVAKSVSEGSEPPNVFVRLRRRF